MPADDVEVKAVFEAMPAQEYSVTVTSDGNGTASASQTSAIEGTEITLTATPTDGYKFKEWQVVSGGITIEENKFTMPANNVEVKAIFEKIEGGNDNSESGDNGENSGSSDNSGSNNENNNNNQNNNTDNSGSNSENNNQNNNTNNSGSNSENNNWNNNTNNSGNNSQDNQSKNTDSSDNSTGTANDQTITATPTDNANHNANQNNNKTNNDAKNDNSISDKQVESKPSIESQTEESQTEQDGLELTASKSGNDNTITGTENESGIIGSEPFNKKDVWSLWWIIAVCGGVIIVFGLGGAFYVIWKKKL